MNTSNFPWLVFNPVLLNSFQHLGISEMT